jgi:hypothetical protein
MNDHPHGGGCLVTISYFSTVFQEASIRGRGGYRRGLKTAPLRIHCMSDGKGETKGSNFNIVVYD